MDNESYFEEAVEITKETRIGSSQVFPYERGNCFSVRTKENKEYRIVNFNVENIRYLISNLGLTWPVKIKLLSDKIAVIHDERISDRIYHKYFCTACCPIHLLPSSQRLEQLREIARRNRKEYNSDYGYYCSQKLIGDENTL